MNYALCLIRTKPLDGGKIPHSLHEIDTFVGLSHEEYKQSSEANQILYDFSCQARFLTIVALNYRDYFKALDTGVPAYIRRMDKNAQDSIDMETINLELNRLLINYISSVTLYLKRTEKYISKKHGDDSENLRKFNDYRFKAYDSSFSYRFVYFLRNYAQHAGLPIDSVTLTSTVSPKNPDLIIHSLWVRILRDSLLNNYRYSGSKERALKGEIARQPPEIDLSPHLIAMMKEVNNLNSQFIRDELDTLKPSATYLNGLLGRLPSHEDADPILFAFELVKDETALGGGNTIRNGRIAEISIKAIKLLLSN